MKVIDSSPQFWYLLQDSNNLILTVSCESSFVGYDFTMALNSEEIANYEQDGSTFLSELAEGINYSCPIVKGSASVFKERNIDAQYSDAIGNAVERWQATHNAD